MSKRMRSSSPAPSASHETPDVTASSAPQNEVAGEGSGVRALPRKRFYRQRAHANPFSDHQLNYPSCPEAMDWSAHYPDLASLPESERTPKFLDVGCGFGGLLMDLSPKYPKKLMLGMEIRIQVTQFVADKILALRSQATEGSHSYNNISVLRANAMKFLPNFIPKHSLEKIFFLFPDPHFKARKHKARIISSTLLAEYAYILQPGGKLYAATDVEGLWNWMERHLDECELFRRIPNEREVDEVVEYVLGSTEEGKKVARNKGSKWVGVWERI